MRIEIYSDIICPWCYIGERRLDRALDGLSDAEGVEVVFRPFQLDPSLGEQAVLAREYLRRKFGASLEGVERRVAAVASAEGIRMDFASALIVNTFTAHRLLRLAESEYGASTQGRLAKRLFQAHFEEGEDVSDPARLAELATSVGMDGERVREYLGGTEGTQETREALAGAVGRGIRAVPTFVIDGAYVVEGAQPTSTLLQVLEQVAAEEQAAGICSDGLCAG